MLVAVVLLWHGICTLELVDEVIRAGASLGNVTAIIATLLLGLCDNVIQASICFTLQNRGQISPTKQKFGEFGG